MVGTTLSKHAECTESDEPLMPAATTPDSFDGSKRSEVSAPTTISENRRTVPANPPDVRNRILVIPSYGGRATQQVDLDADTFPDISEDSSESSDEEPSPADSGIDVHFDFSKYANDEEWFLNSHFSIPGTRTKGPVRNLEDIESDA
ncbi:hypothetical protein AAVH_00140 [Aphelenchoides avenae]|nr:hypothetical protein AAVH_00140 [Aphelenchus avenae]